MYIVFIYVCLCIYTHPIDSVSHNEELQKILVGEGDLKAEENMPHYPQCNPEGAHSPQRNPSSETRKWCVRSQVTMT